MPFKSIRLINSRRVGWATHTMLSKKCEMHTKLGLGYPKERKYLGIISVDGKITSHGRTVCGNAEWIKVTAVMNLQVHYCSNGSAVNVRRAWSY